MSQYVLLDSLNAAALVRSQPSLVQQLGLYAMNVRLFSRPLHVYAADTAEQMKEGKPNVGVYIDQEFSRQTLRSLLTTVLGRPVEVVPFQNISEMARCLKEWQSNAPVSGCSAQISWAAIVEQDASLAVDVFAKEYRRMAGRDPLPAPIDVQVGVSVNELEAGISMVVAPTNRVRRLGGGSAPPSPLNIAAISRADGTSLRELQALERPATSGVLATVLAILPPFVARLQAGSSDADADPKFPYPVVLTNDDRPSDRIRTALADGYLRAASPAATQPPCTAVAERIHRAFLFNAYLERPDDLPKKIGLGGQVISARGSTRGLADLFTSMKLNPDVGKWPEMLGLSDDRSVQCPAVPDEKYAEEKLYFSNASLTFQFRASTHLRNGALDAAAACLRKALGNNATPSCHRADRATYSFYYNPYFYYAAQQAAAPATASPSR